jgi:hypothetical protein
LPGRLRREALPITISSSSPIMTSRPSPFLPDLLSFDNGTRVASARQWEGRRAELWSRLERELLGSMPTRPRLTLTEVLNKTVDGATVSTYVALTFTVQSGPEVAPANASFVIELLELQPRERSRSGARAQSKLFSTAAAARALRPLFVTQWNHRGPAADLELSTSRSRSARNFRDSDVYSSLWAGGWAVAGAARGHLSAVIPTSDVQDAAPDMQALHPAASFGLIAARAFVCSLALDYLLTLPDVDGTRVHISGHSRNGKQSLIAAAYDTRFSAVVGSSPGAPIASPYRFTTSNFYGEGPRTGLPTSDGWWLPTVMRYDGRPERMPIDGHAVLGLIAPRRVMLATGRHDFESDLLFANEQARGRAPQNASRPIGHTPPNTSALWPTRRPTIHHRLLPTLLPRVRSLRWFLIRCYARAGAPCGHARIHPPRCSTGTEHGQPAAARASWRAPRL